MSKRQFKSQASSSRAISGTGFGGFGSSTSGSNLSYLAEPPNLSFISDANVAVCFKNLSKKDGTTKSKALEDLRAYVQAHPYEQGGGTEEAVLEAWVKFYPRISIDNSRRVRELSHNLQYELLKSTRKRMEKFIPKIVGSWLAGTYDRDRAVSRAALDGVKSFLDTDSKVTVFWKRCQAQILEYAQEAINETPQTLSDERTMSSDDVQAKYFRVVGSSISLVFNLLVKLNVDDIVKSQDKYDEFLSSNKKLWTLASCEDSFTRKVVDQLLDVCIDKQSAIIEADLELISHAFIAEALRSSQASSTLQLLNTLKKLTSRFPQIWNSAYKGKKTAYSRLRHFVEKGSQGGPPAFWQFFHDLLCILPTGTISTDIDTSLEFFKAFRDGISNREEPRSNGTQAWSNYFETVKLLTGRLNDSTMQGKALQESIYPVFEQYLHPTTANSKWSSGNNTAILAKGYQICASLKGSQSEESFSNEWKRLGDDFIQRLNTSLPEQSKDYHKSQSAVVAESHRWFGLLSAILDVNSPDTPKEILIAPSSQIITTAVTVEINRNGKPYSAAATIEAALRLAPNFFRTNAAPLEAVVSFLENHLPKLIVSPSSTYLISVLNLLRSIPNQESVFESVWQSTIDGLLALPRDEQKVKVFTALISNHAVTKLSQEDPALQDFMLATVMVAVRDQNKTEAVELFAAAITFNSLSAPTEKNMLDQIIGLADLDNGAIDGALTALELISKKNPGLLRKENKTYIALITRVLALTEISESEISFRARRLKTILEDSEDTTGSMSPMLHVILENLETASPQSLTIDTLIQQAQSLLETSIDLTSLLPDTTKWKESLNPFLAPGPNPALGVMRPFAGAAFLVQTQFAERHVSSRDLSGYSIPLRMAMYTARLTGDSSAVLQEEYILDILYLLGLTAQLVQDQIDLQEDCHLLTYSADPDVLAELQDFLLICNSGFNHIFSTAKNWLESEVEPESSSHLVQALISRLLQDTCIQVPRAFHASRYLSVLLQRLVNECGWHNARGEIWLQKLDILKSSTTNVLGATSVLLGLQDSLGTSKLVNNLCNRLISDIAGASAQSEKTLSMLVLLNAALAVYDEGDLPVAQNRLVFAVKQILSFTSELPVTGPRLASEACYSLHRLLPSIKDVYGTYWETALTFCVDIWESIDAGDISNDRIPMIGMSLKLYAILRNLKNANDDLDESLTLLSDKIAHGMVHLLKIPRFNRRRRTESLPMTFVDEQLSRELAKMPLSHIKDDILEFYPLVASDSRTVQSTAFDILHRALPEAQQQISLDVALEQRDAQLPEELLSLLLDAPTISSFPDEELADFPTSIRGYLLSWQLVYDSYSNASFKVRNDYSDILKSENYIGPLLDFLFDVLGHSAGYPINLTNFETSKIRLYDMWVANDVETPERNMQYLLVNTYYLCLKYMPSLVKNWWVDCKSKQTRIAVETWTEKFFSPLIIQDTMDDVSKWAEEQEVTEDEKELLIKVSKRSREVFAGYEVDDMMMQILIRLPANYPLEGVKVEGVNRVAVSEKKWTSWLMITQGVITFSNGSITDGLNIFRKNVTGALKGQNECAICYSIISSDKKMPDKRCQTCKNLFHASCLFKWFATSNQSTCPLCRNPFNYGTDTARRMRAAVG